MCEQKSDINITSDSIDTEEPVRGGADAQSKALGGAGLGDIAATVTVMLSAAGGVKMLLEMVKLWVEDRKERRIKLKRGDFEVEVQGGMSQKEIQQKLELFWELTKDAKENEVKIIKP